LHLELTTAAAVRLGWVGWLLFSAVAILRASTKDMPLSALSFCTFFSSKSAHNGQSLVTLDALLWNMQQLLSFEVIYRFRYSNM